MTEHIGKGSPHSIYGKMEVPYKYFVGIQASQFFSELRDNKKIMGVKCPQCNVVYMPPRSVCGKCFSKLDEWVELGGKGTVTSYTVVDYTEPMHPIKAPFAYGIIQMDGSDTGITHFLGEVELDKITIGMKVEPVFAEERKGNMLDIKYFRPL